MPRKIRIVNLEDDHTRNNLAVVQGSQRFTVPPGRDVTLVLDTAETVYVSDRWPDEIPAGEAPSEEERASTAQQGPGTVGNGEPTFAVIGGDLANQGSPLGNVTGEPEAETEGEAGNEGGEGDAPRT